MFIYDKPIESEEGDFLGRKKFSQHLGASLLNWKEDESLVIAIYGEWGSGKSSVINLALETIKKSKEDNKPTTIEFNPWSFSEQHNLSEHFFNEIAKNLEIKNESDKDKEIATKLKFYASLLSLTPNREQTKSLMSKLFLGFGLLSISSGQILEWLKLSSVSLKVFLFVIGFILILVEIAKDYLTKLQVFFENKSQYKFKSILEVKKELKKELKERNKKLIVVIDDIDRLNQNEIRQIFRLIRINADFPNTIYLLAFDRKIIEQNLEEQKGVNGKDYLDKIVQVNFDVPFAKESKVHNFLFKELNRVLSVLPESAHKYFGQNETYWTNVFHSGYKHFFKNIRDVKRYINSLEFNITQMYQDTVMEVNPIDFIAIEAIRVVTPDFYSFMKNKKTLFTSTESRNTSRLNLDQEKSEILQEIDKLPDEIKISLRELIARLFPQIANSLQPGHGSYGHDWQSNWTRNMRVCSSENFDSYFTLVPGGDDEEISYYEMEKILSSTYSLDEFENILRQYIENKKISKVLSKLQDYTEDQKFIPQTNAKNIVQALFNISDEIPYNPAGMFSISLDMELMRVIYQILIREKDKSKNYDIFKEAIPLSKGLFGPVEKISLESSREERRKDPSGVLVPIDNLEELQLLCINKISNAREKLLSQDRLLYILYRWKEWDKTESWKSFIQEILSDDDKTLLFVSRFISESSSQSMGDYGVKKHKGINYKSLADFVELNELKTRLENVKTGNIGLYEKYKETIDFYLTHFDKRDNQDRYFEEE